MNIEFTPAVAAISPVTAVGVKAGAPETEQPLPAHFPSAGGRAAASTEESAKLERSLRSLGQTLAESRISLNFSRDEESGALVVRMVDDGTGETIRQLPSEAALRLANAFGKLQGLIFKSEA